MEFEKWIEHISKAVDGVGVAVIVVGAAWALMRFGVAYLRRAGEPLDRYRDTRQSVGRAILLGLEVLVAADIIRTVAISPTFSSVGILAGIVAVRTFLSFTIEMEISGRWPWQHSRSQ